MDARTLAALAANPGCGRRALLDAAGVDKGAVAEHLGRPAPFGQSQFSIVRGNAFEARVKADGCAELLRLLCERLGLPAPDEAALPDLSAVGPAGRAERTRQALEEATAAGGWSLLDHPMLRLEVAGSAVHLEPDAVVVRPDGRWTVVEIKSFPILDGCADPAKVGAAARQSAVYVLALRALAERIGRGEPEHTVVLVCPKDFSNLPTCAAVDVRKQLSVTVRQLTRLTRVEDIVSELPEGTTFDLALDDDRRTPRRPVEELAAAVDAVPAAYAPDCLSVCELAFHCRARAHECGAVEALGRGVRGELGALASVDEVLAAAAAGLGGAWQADGEGSAPAEHVSGGGCGVGGGTDAHGYAEDGGDFGGGDFGGGDFSGGDRRDFGDDAVTWRLREAARLRAEALAGTAAGGRA
ncbi:hypothetical protein [Wenjunlia tyrosinilytica]|uniref:Secreted protein n=1 Tax=Wenjunlia tyrosinilytica TaxID=1544741 RepID=A0A917ZPJ4_9ACTN|nr:hypothetical protein [Wenjunlia tyrosinilytica]GGO88856.1 hypothetical protein GCM10012280_30640 [Wenjunlia tyrosinilytica]